MEDNEKYDSTNDTKCHIGRVAELLWTVRQELSCRADFHDLSKLKEPEKSIFDKCTVRLRGLTYGSDEYKSCLAEMKPALNHHYANNRHHPEYHENGVSGMTLIDLVEMLCDWKAATERHADGSLERSIRVNQQRFNLSPQLEKILENTRIAMKW